MFFKRQRDVDSENESAGLHVLLTDQKDQKSPDCKAFC